MADGKRLTDVHSRAMRRMDDWASAMWDERLQCLADRRFALIAGAQWEGDFEDLLDNLPKMEINKVRRGVRRILSAYRKNRVTVDFRPSDKAADSKVADMLDGLFRADEQACNAGEAYDAAFDDAVSGGFGAIRLRNEFVDEFDADDERQRVAIEPIFDADIRVAFDLNSKRQDKRDAKWCGVLNAYTREAFNEQWPDSACASVNVLPGPAARFDWASPDMVYVLEYYEVEETPDRLLTYQHPLINDKPAVYRESGLSEDDRADLEAKGWRLDKVRRIKRQRVHKYLMSGRDVLSDEGYIAGRWLPVVPIYGERQYVQNVERCQGYVRHSKDANRLYNLQVSKLAEGAAHAQHERPILLPEQVRGHEQTWADGSWKRLPYQLINPIVDENGQMVASGPVGTVTPSQIPPVMGALIEITNRDLKEMTGAMDGANALVSNVSADAVEQVNTRVDDEAFVYMDNFAKAMKRTGEIWLDMMRDIADADEERATVSEDGQQGVVTLGSDADIWTGKYDVFPDVGPSSASRRDATARQLVQMVPAVADDPELKTVLVGMALVNMDGEGLDDVRRWTRLRLVRAGVLQPTEEERVLLAKEAEGRQPDPNAMLAQAAAEQAQAEAEKARAGTIKTMAEAEKVRAQTIEALAGIDRADMDQTLRAVQTAAQQLGSAGPETAPAQ